jgi:phage-related minor tail protein
MKTLIDLLGSWQKKGVKGNPLAGGTGSLGTGIPHAASGGIVRRPTLAMIGEAGPEAVVPLNRTRGNGPLGDVLGMNITVNAGLVSSPEQVGQQIIEAIQRAQRRSGPVFAPA